MNDCVRVIRLGEMKMQMKRIECGNQLYIHELEMDASQVWYLNDESIKEFWNDIVSI